MIGIIADPADDCVVREFFELFKTPWEFCRADAQYDVVICAGDRQFAGTAKLVLFYSSEKVSFDDEREIRNHSQPRRSRVLLYKGDRIPIYGGATGFSETSGCILTDEESRESVAYVRRSGPNVLVRIGYDLFSEIRLLLTAGQPAANASTPTLELHITLLRNLIIEHGIPLAEIPPIPDGYRFVACLTHDVDHPSIRQHKWDHTMFGFLYRAVFISVENFIRRRISLGDLATNWIAALKLPFVHLGLAKDFWREFYNRYLELETGFPSTFFVIPFKNCPGKKVDGPAPISRAARYSADEVSDTIQELLNAGCEIGLHGIDAWRDRYSGREELAVIRRLTSSSEAGVRMHWLYYGQLSPAKLEAAGAAYDSSIGYNETIGYRAGTTQVFKPLDVSRLLELPLHVMDTAMFYRGHMGLSPRQAKKTLCRMTDDVIQCGGCLTVNWHDRSICPERLWDVSYCDLIQDLKSKGAWFATAGQSVSWFRKRRSATFEEDPAAFGGVRVKVTVGQEDDLPALRLRIHQFDESCGISCHGSASYVDMAVDESGNGELVLGASK